MKRIREDKYFNHPGKHAYDVYAYVAGSSNEQIIFDNVCANNRDQAARIVERDGHRVVSVNMVG